MNKHSLLSAKAAMLSFCFLFSALVANAQGDPGTDDDGFIVSIVSPPSIAKYISNGFLDCGWIGTSGFGPDVTEELCGEVVWAPDSLACSPLPAGSLNGKIALIRRGTCGFSLKIYHAQQAGAKAVIILNHYANPLDGPCEARIDASTYFGGMSGLDSASAVTIPAIFLQRLTGEEIDGALKAGEKVEVCFVFPRFTQAWAAYSYAMPASQVDTLGAMVVNFINRDNNVVDNLVIKVDIQGPNGYSESFEALQDPIDPGAELLVGFGEFYVPPAVPGEYTATFSSNLYTEGRDTLTRKFVVTDYTYALDNLNLRLDGGAALNTDFANGGFQYQTAALYFTGDAGAVATHATFGIANIDSVYVPGGDDETNAVFVFLFDGDSDEDGTINLSGGFNSIESDVVAIGTYIMKGGEQEDKLIDVALEDFFEPGQAPVLKPNHPYYLSLKYDGINNGSGRCIAFTNTANESYLVINGGSTSPIFIGQYYGGGWSDRTIVQRLQLEGYTSSAKPEPKLSADKFSITPNPGNEYVYLNLDLESTNKQVVVSLFDMGSQPVRQSVVRNIQEGQIRLDVKDLPVGTYIMTIRTDEGVAVQKVMVLH
ncbi:MAG: T9SS type A sorting domain-containing protein [Saprospiraceae bacterium]|nr:T9SS type A sorting domain-containing protein [Saprospiraceae bacterium]